jgi:hypothetical protein
MKEGQPPKVTLPGTLYQRGDRWWWSVKLPGEDRARSRPLKEKGAKAAVQDLAVAEALALALWEQNIREQAALQIQVENSQKIAALKAQFLDKVRHFTEVVESATAKAQAEARARAEAEARLREKAAPAMSPTGTCDCCGSNGLPATELRHIDSGQRLCPRCLAALRADAARIPASAAPATRAEPRQPPPTANHTTV